MNGHPTDPARGFSALAATAALVFCASIAPASAQAPAAARPIVAVFPLESRSGDAAQNFFAEGMTDEIAGALASVPGLGVVARSSSFVLKPASRDAKTIGQALNAAYVVQGAARMAGDRVQFDLALGRTADGATLWSKTYDAGRDGIFDIEDDAARSIAAALGAPVKPGESPVRSRVTDFDAYLDFLRAKVAARPRGAKAAADAAVLLEKVLAREPDFAPAAAMLAYSYALTPLFAPSLRAGMPQEEHKIVAQTIRAAMPWRTAPRNATRRARIGFVALGYANLVQRKMVAAEDAFRQALALNPNQANGLHGYSQQLAALGRIKESLAMRDHLQAGEQFITNYTADTAEIYWLDGDTDKAIAMLQPFRPGRTLELGLILASAGRYKEAAAALREMPASNYPSGMLEAAAKILDSAPAKATAPGELPRVGNLSFAYMHVGAPERVLEFYEDEVRGDYFQPISSTWFWHLSYAPVRTTPRFKTVARDLGLVDYWRARGWPAQCQPDGADDFACH